MALDEAVTPSPRPLRLEEDLVTPEADKQPAPGKRLEDSFQLVREMKLDGQAEDPFMMEIEASAESGGYQQTLKLIDSTWRSAAVLRAVLRCSGVFDLAPGDLPRSC